MWPTAADRRRAGSGSRPKGSRKKIDHAANTGSRYRWWVSPKGVDRGRGQRGILPCWDNGPMALAAQRSGGCISIQRLRDEAHRFAIGTHRANAESRWRNATGRCAWCRCARKAGLAGTFPVCQGGGARHLKRLKGFEAFSALLRIYAFSMNAGVGFRVVA